MLLPALRALGADAGVECTLIWMQLAPGDAPRLAGLFPFQRMRQIRGLPAQTLSSWCHDSFMLGTPLVRAETAPQCLVTLLDWLPADGGGASAAEFRNLPGDGAFYSALADALCDRDATVMAAPPFTRALLRKAENAECYLQNSLSRGHRKAIRRKERRLQERGEVAHVALGPGDDPKRWIGDFLRLEASGWKGRRGSALACTVQGTQFASESLMGAHARNRLQIVGIDVDGRPITRCCNLLAGAGAYAYRTAYDEAYAHYSPGIMAEIDTIRAFHDLSEVQWMDSITDPDNATINRLWSDRRTIHSLVVGTRAWGEMCVSLLPVLRWVKHSLQPEPPRPGQFRTWE
jgi:hypothetical protein